MRRFKNFEHFSFFFEGLVSSLDFLNHSPRLLVDAANVLDQIKEYVNLCSGSNDIIHILLHSNFCACTDMITFYEVERFKKLRCSVLRVTITPKCIIVKTL